MRSLIKKMPGQGPRAKNWAFTLNNYTPADLDRLSGNENGRSTIPGVAYLIFGREIGASGTPHLQGTVCFVERKRLSQVKALIGEAHCTVVRNLPHSVEYCKKDGDWNAVGDERVVVAPGKKGERSDIEDFKNAVKEGVTCMEILRENHSDAVAKYPKFCEEYVKDALRPKDVNVARHELRPWQQTLYEKLRGAPGEREIIFIVDRTGNTGKSWFSRYYCDLHENAQIIVPGKKADMAYVVKEWCKVFFFDCPRSKQGDFVQYDFLEELKNGYFFSPKYESRIKKLPTPHIVVCMNETPDMTKLSDDRYTIINL